MVGSVAGWANPPNLPCQFSLLPISSPKKRRQNDNNRDGPTETVLTVSLTVRTLSDRRVLTVRVTVRTLTVKQKFSIIKLTQVARRSSPTGGKNSTDRGSVFT